MKSKIIFAGIMGVLLAASGAEAAPVETKTLATEGYVRSAYMQVKALANTKAALQTSATAGNLAQINSSGQYVDSGVALSGLAAATDLDTKQDLLPTSAVAGKVLKSDGSGGFTWEDDNNTTVNVDGKANKVVPVAVGNVAVLASDGDIADGGALGSAAFADTTDFDAAGSAAAVEALLSNACTSSQALLSDGSAGYLCANLTGDTFAE
ncbi:MAG: hypothetical protein LBD50_03375 [Rickettsiales bacterium]|jgi:hypothetical protein|nr:hypothetical protein [Rickettsiales bacterium]